ncbi:DUF1488 family protein [Azospirillum thermophilum]|uniref:DUF1488 domain-containing protein n=1 Tax=Azospirillum thermophilum TaxID=2202148 RepID=A0A2S2CZZ1_9PROT|nr:DUF1488 family protein [Azospirillum thermophilum]AWK90081.1 hypothetical protein DEW08_29290 [Azospirillum thermophilum]
METGTGAAGTGDGQPVWRQDIEALAFRPPGHDGRCAVHRLAFRTLIGGGQPPAAAECLAYFRLHRPAFERAAADKIARRGLPPDASLHLTSRDVGRAMTAEATDTGTAGAGAGRRVN